ncbi:MAG: hypothetical protein ACK4IX_18475 [Candidatus Sericytochromatia bacterium]|jgi:hypothetical protein
MEKETETNDKKPTRDAILEFLKAKKQPPPPDKGQRGKKTIENRGFSSKRKS